ncbi:phage/plasmid primase, P4 family [Acinetobacter sp.]|uniref:phage/plasmid primase, P4 family n=1 Tax=Acinetobacter sp. TaxID=472 RepID=UPI003D021C20
MSNFREQGKKLLAYNYMVVPIKPGEKRPALKDWQDSRISAADLLKYPNCGIGVLTGQGQFPICAVDIDVLDEDLASEYADWCRDNLGVSCERIGKAPKMLMVYRAEEPNWAKSISGWFATPEEAVKPFKEMVKQRLEILGKGQQFVAYHIHPDTGKPYEWVDFFGGLTEFSAETLPVVTKEQIAAAVEKFEEMAQKHGLVRIKNSKSKVGALTSHEIDDEEDPLMTTTMPIGLLIDDAKRHLEFVDNEDFETWLRVGMSLHHEFNAGADALHLWDDWSSTASNYSSFEDLEYRWATFSQTGSSIITAHWLLKTSRDAVRVVGNEEKRQALDDIKAEILECADSVELINTVAKKAGIVARGDIALRTEIASLIRGRFKAITGASLALPDARLAMNSGIPAKTRGEDGRHELSELGNVGRMIDRYGDDLRYVPQTESWFAWNGVYWQPVTQLEILQYATATVKALPNEALQIKSDEDRAKHKAFCVFSQRIRMVEDMVKWARSDERILTYVTKFDANMHLLGCSNGAVDLRTGELLEPNREHLISYNTGVNYHPNAKCPVFEQTVLDAFFGDAEMAAFFQRVIGYIAIGNPKESIILIPYGSGNNGKSTIFKSIALALGDYAKTANADTFLGDGRANGGGAREDILRLRGSRYVYSTEPEEGKELKEGLIKAMTGGEALPARGLYSRHTIEVQPTWTVVMPTNHKPIIKGDDYGIWRRLMLVPFTRNYDKDPNIKKDVNRSAKLLRELPGILRWIVQGALDYKQNGLKPPQGVLAAKDEYKQENDLLADWICDCCDLVEGYRETNKNLWQSWQAWAVENGRQHMFKGEPSFGKKLKNRFETWRTMRGRGYVGIRVRESAEFADLSEQHSCNNSHVQPS